MKGDLEAMTGIIIQIIKSIIPRLDFCIEKDKEHLKSYGDLKDGHMVCKVRSMTRITYELEYSENGDRKHKYLGGPENETVQRYKARRFYKERLRVETNNRKVLEKALGKLEDPSVIAIHKKLPNSYKILPECCFVDDEEEELKGWAAKKYKPNKYSLPLDPNVSRNGRRVRSKSEAMICDDCDYEHLPYVYDSLFVAVDDEGVEHTFYPDFVFKCKDGTYIIWEHFGRLDDPEYAKRCMEKILEYHKCGFTLGDNLIITSDNKDHCMNERMVLETIEKIKKRIA